MCKRHGGEYLKRWRRIGTKKIKVVESEGVDFVGDETAQQVIRWGGWGVENWGRVERGVWPCGFEKEAIFDGLFMTNSQIDKFYNTIYNKSRCKIWFEFVIG